jgi:hypothetical protein
MWLGFRFGIQHRRHHGNPCENGLERAGGPVLAAFICTLMGPTAGPAADRLAPATGPWVSGVPLTMGSDGPE